MTTTNRYELPGGIKLHIRRNPSDGVEPDTLSVVILWASGHTTTTALHRGEILTNAFSLVVKENLLRINAIILAEWAEWRLPGDTRTATRAFQELCEQSLGLEPGAWDESEGEI